MSVHALPCLASVKLMELTGQLLHLPRVSGQWVEQHELSSEPYRTTLVLGAQGIQFWPLAPMHCSSTRLLSNIVEWLAFNTSGAYPFITLPTSLSCYPYATCNCREHGGAMSPE